MKASIENTINVPSWLPGWLENTWNFLAVYPFVLSMVIVVVGLCLAFIVRQFLLFWGDKISRGFGRFEFKITKRANIEIVKKLIHLGSNVAALLIGYICLVTAIHTLPLSDFSIKLITRILISILFLQLIRAGLKASHIMLEMLSGLRDRFPIIEERTLPLFDLMLTIIIVGIGSYALLQVWNIDATAWLASAGVIGIAVGFAARDTLANLFAGFFIIADTPYKLGDYIVLDSKERGMVTKVGIRSTRLLTRDDVEIIIPNSVIANSKIVNESGGRWLKYRIRIKVGVAYGSDLKNVVKLLEDVAKEHRLVCRDPIPRVRMRRFGDSSLDFELLCWIERPVQRGLVTHELYMAVYDAMNRHSIEIPFPQRDLWIRKTAESLA
jgi:small-conductance mechanosensitive channel